MQIFIACCTVKMTHFSAVLLILACASSCTAQILPVNISQGVVRGQNVGSCPSPQRLDSQNMATRSEIQGVLRDTVAPYLNCPCGGAGPWTRIADLNFTDTSVACPSGFTLTTTPVRTCGRATGAAPACNSIIFPVNGQSYSRVCGRVNGYQEGSVDGLQSVVQGGETIEDIYVDGVSLTYGPAGSRQHIWTFAAALYETNTGAYNGAVNCDCTNTNEDWPYTIPSFIGNNYFCATGNRGPGFVFGNVYSDDALWDGKGCGPTNSCCQFNKPPWFCTSIPQPTTQDIELRACGDQPENDEDLLLSLIEIYIM